MRFRLPDRICVRFRTVRCARLRLRSVGKRAGRSVGELDALLARVVPTGRKECPARRTARLDTPTGFRVAPEACLCPGCEPRLRRGYQRAHSRLIVAREERAGGDRTGRSVGRQSSRPLRRTGLGRGRLLE